MADKNEEMTLEAYAKQAKSTEKGPKKNNINGKKRLDKKLNGVKSAIRRTGRGGNDNNNRSAGKPRQNSNKNSSFNNNNSFNKNSKNNHSSNNSRNSSRPPLSENRAPKTKVVRPIPEHKKRIVKVYNLVPSINNEEFYNLFVKYGSIEQSKIETDKKGKSEEKGYVVYRDNDAAKRAIDDLNGVELEGRIITVEFMKDGEKLGERPAGQGSSSSGEKSERGSERGGDRERRSSDAPHGIQKRIFKNKEDRFERRDNRGGNRRDNNNNNRRDYDRNNRRGNNYGSSNNNGNNRNRSNGGSSRNNNRKFSR